jgi:cytoskeletal protein CcmA (bactofilin family)
MIFKKEDEEEGFGPPETKKERRMESNEVTIVGAGAKLEGTLVSAGSLRIDGQVKGQINADGDVTLSAQSQVEADIRAQNVSIAGRFKGNVIVKAKAHLARGGRIDGNVTSKSLVVEEGGILHGQSIMDPSAQAQGGQAQGGQAQAGQATQQTNANAQQPRPVSEVKVP